ncbi:MAG: DegV family protein [Chloroflexi bacterium]|nr:DegV family protein [Chloroflexota bacterium]
MAVRLVTDSTADLSPELVRAHHVTVVPLNVLFGDQTYRDGIDITADEFYQRLVQGPVLPRTSQPSAGLFIDTYKKIATFDDQVLSLHISAKLSGTVNSALLAQKELPSYQLHIIDSQFVSMALGLTVLRAADVLAKGATVQQAIEATQEAIRAMRVFVICDTLEYLEKGGRIGKAQALLGSLLQIKPLVTVRDGEVHPLERVRTRTKALDRLCEMATAVPKPSAVAVCYSTTPDEAERLAQRLSIVMPRDQIMLSRFGPVLGTYVGPGALAVAVRGGQ